jgi:hypothetical protein
LKTGLFKKNWYFLKELMSNKVWFST